jgi:hypothetical protein
MPKLPNVADIGTEFKDEIMSGARKVAFGAVVIGTLVILGPRVPSMLNKFMKGSISTVKTVAGFGEDAYNAGKKAGNNQVAQGIDNLLA